MIFKDNNSMESFINMASQKIGTNPQDMKKKIDSGKLDNLISTMKPQDAKKIQDILSNPALAQQMLNTPQAQMLIKQFMK